MSLAPSTLGEELRKLRTSAQTYIDTPFRDGDKVTVVTHLLEVFLTVNNDVTIGDRFNQFNKTYKAALDKASAWYKFSKKNDFNQLWSKVVAFAEAYSSERITAEIVEVATVSSMVLSQSTATVFRAASLPVSITTSHSTSVVHMGGAGRGSSHSLPSGSAGSSSPGGAGIYSRDRTGGPRNIRAPN